MRDFSHGLSGDLTAFFRFIYGVYEKTVSKWYHRYHPKNTLSLFALLYHKSGIIQYVCDNIIKKQLNNLDNSINDINFWNDKERANIVISRANELRDIITSVREVEKGINNNLETLELIVEDDELYIRR